MRCAVYPSPPEGSAPSDEPAVQIFLLIFLLTGGKAASIDVPARFAMQGARCQPLNVGLILFGCMVEK